MNETYFPADYFDYVIIDEFHHAVTDQYRRIVEYFQPQFLLGLTATPERMDGKNIYEICDYNVPYQISLKEAINKGMLVPFHYYGVYDETDYSGLRIVKGRYDEQELNQAYIGNERRYDLIYKYYRKYRSLRAIGFCCSRQHAEDMAKEFCQRGIASAAVYSGENGAYAEERNEAIRKLKSGEIRVIFSVDMFNEGVDIASLDMVMFLRPTESPVVFLQQLGRGLRLYKGKEYLNVLDFIGNYEKAGKAPLLLSGEQSFGKKGSCEYQDLEYSDDCIVDFDMRLIDLFKEMDKKKLTLKMQIQQEYYRVKELLDGKRPSRMDLFTYMDDEIYRICVSGSHAKENPFQHYLDFLYELDELSEDEQKLYAGIGREFIQTIETTEMQKVYKMPILYSFYNHGNIRLAVTDEEVLESWKEFFDTGTNWKDFPNVNTYEDYKKVTDNAFKENAKIELCQFREVRANLLELLNRSDSVREEVWQKQIHGLLRLLYPKYIAGVREVVIKGVDRHEKRPDFLLVDANGYIDILEIKKPNVQILTKQSSYRNNYVPVRELAGAIQQIEKYIYCLNVWGTEGEKVLQKQLSEKLPNNVMPKVINPQGILLLGRSEQFNQQQKNDFELIKRQYKHIADIMTYDDLIQRIDNILAALNMEIRVE